MPRRHPHAAPQSAAQRQAKRRLALAAQERLLRPALILGLALLTRDQAFERHDDVSEPAHDHDADAGPLATD